MSSSLVFTCFTCWQLQSWQLD